MRASTRTTTSNTVACLVKRAYLLRPVQSTLHLRLVGGVLLMFEALGRPTPDALPSSSRTSAQSAGSSKHPHSESRDECYHSIVSAFRQRKEGIQPVSSMRASLCSMEALLYGSCPARVEPECTRRRAVGSGCGVRAAHRLDRPDGEWASLPHRNPADRRHGAWRRRSNSTGRAARVAAELGIIRVFSSGGRHGRAGAHVLEDPRFLQRRSMRALGWDRDGCECRDCDSSGEAAAGPPESPLNISPASQRRVAPGKEER